MAYKPFLIATGEAALQTGREAWKIPPNAFSSWENAYIESGFIKKRRGLTTLADTGNGNPIIGIFRHLQNDGSSQQIVADSRRLYRYDTGTGTLVDLDGADVLTGTNENFLSWEGYLGSTYMTNNVDLPRKWTGTAVSNLSLGGVLDTAKYLKVLRERVLYINTVESGTRFPVRIRYSNAGAPETLTPADYFDLPISGEITGATYLRNSLIVWAESSVWLIEYTGSATTPFRPIKLDSTIGCKAPYSAISKWDLSFAFDKTGVVYTDGRSVRRLDALIPDFYLNFNLGKAGLVYGSLYEEREQLVWLYPEFGSDFSNKLLWFDYNQAFWGTERYPGEITCIGTFPLEESIAWDDLSFTWNEWDSSWDSGRNELGYPLFVSGDTTGGIASVANTASDDGADITVDLLTARLNPFQKSGRRSRLGYIDLLLSRFETEISIDFYQEFETTAYFTATVDAGEIPATKSKDWVRAYPGSGSTSASMHQIGIRHTGTTPIEIHAMMLWFAPEGLET